MKLENSMAGTMESGDIMIRISPGNGKGVEINLDSVVAFQFGRRIEEVIRETLRDLDIDDAVVNAYDKGALDCTIRARVTTAAVRATGKDVWQD